MARVYVSDIIVSDEGEFVILSNGDQLLGLTSASIFAKMNDVVQFEITGMTCGKDGTPRVAGASGRKHAPEVIDAANAMRDRNPTPKR